MRVGWKIVIEGKDFDPSEFFETSRIQPNRIWDEDEVEYVIGETLDELQDLHDAISAGKPPEVLKRYRQRKVEFTDWHEGPYRLNMATEALDYLMTHREEFKTLCNLPGIEKRCLSFEDTLEENGVSDFHFDSDWVAILAELKLSVRVSVYRSHTCG